MMDNAEREREQRHFFGELGVTSDDDVEALRTLIRKVVSSFAESATPCKGTEPCSCRERTFDYIRCVAEREFRACGV